MALSLASRHVGEITVVKCSGSITEGAGTTALNDCLTELLPHYHDIVLDLSDVTFIDSSGLGLLVRFLARARSAHGNLTLCGAKGHVAEVLALTRLSTTFEMHDGDAAAVSAFYGRGMAPGAQFKFNTDIICVEPSVDTLAYIRELLKQSGYGLITTTDNIPDALTLVHATRPKLFIISAKLHAARKTGTGEVFNQLVDAGSAIELPPDFSHEDAGDAAAILLSRVRAILNPGDTLAAATP